MSLTAAEHAARETALDTMAQQFADARLAQAELAAAGGSLAVAKAAMHPGHRLTLGAIQRLYESLPKQRARAA